MKLIFMLMLLMMAPPLYAQAGGNVDITAKGVATACEVPSTGELKDDFKSGLCVGSIYVITYIMKASGSLDADVTPMSISKSFVDYVKAHPEREKDNYVPVLLDSLPALRKNQAHK